MPKKGRTGHFKFKKVPQGIRFYLRMHECDALYELLLNYTLDYDTTRKLSYIDKINRYLTTQVFNRLHKVVNGLRQKEATITLSHAEALALWCLINIDQLVPGSDPYEMVTMRNIFSAIDKTML